MEDLNTKLGYLRGLAEGLGISDETKEGKIIRQIILLLDEIGGSIGELKDDYDELFSYVEAIDEDLTDLEDELFEEDDDDDDEDDYDDIYDDFDEIEDYDDDAGFTVECPECRQQVFIDEDVLEDEESFEVLCPKCGKVVFINDEEWESDLGTIEDDEPGKKR